MSEIRRRYQLVPACITFGPLFMSRIGGLMDGWIGVSISLFGVFMLSAGLGMMFHLIVQQPFGPSSTTESPENLRSGS